MKQIEIRTSKLKIHPLLKNRYEALLNPKEYLNLKDDIKHRGIINPIQVNSKYEILDGCHRYKALNELGRMKVLIQVFEYENKMDDEIHILKANMLRRNLSTRQKWIFWDKFSRNFEKGRGGHREKGKEVQCTSLDVNKETAKQLGISSKSVSKARAYAAIIKSHPTLSEYKPSKVLKEIGWINKNIKNESIKNKFIQKYCQLSSKDFASVKQHLIKAAEDCDTENIHGPLDVEEDDTVKNKKEKLEPEDRLFSSISKKQLFISETVNSVLENLKSISLRYAEDQEPFRGNLNPEQKKIFDTVLGKIPKWKKSLNQINELIEQGGYGFYKEDKAILMGVLEDILKGRSSYDIGKHAHQGIRKQE